MACVHDQDLMLAYLYDLLSDENSRALEKDLEESTVSQSTMEQAKKKQSLLQGWQDTAAPQGLLERTMARIQSGSETSAGLVAETELTEQMV